MIYFRGSNGLKEERKSGATQVADAGHTTIAVVRTMRATDCYTHETVRGLYKTRRQEKPCHRQRRRRRRKLGLLATTSLLASIPSASAQSCISLQQSSQCSAFNASSISTDTFNIGLFPFLSSVTDASTFDREIQSYISGSFIQLRFQQLIGCTAFNGQNPDAYYARYTTSVLCNAIVQNSINSCGLSGTSAAPLCADTCALYAQGEQSIASSSLCGSQGINAESQIRSDLTNCALPARSLGGSCIPGVANEPRNCGFSNNLNGLCTYCGSGSPNATDSCCVFSDTERRCQGVDLAIGPASSSASPTPSSTNAPGDTSEDSRSGLSGGQIAGIVVGCVVGGLIVLTLLILACMVLRRRKKPSPPTSVFNQSSQSRIMPPISSVHAGTGPTVGEHVEALPGGRVTRMAAIEGDGSHDDRGGVVAAAGTRSRYTDSSSGDETPRSAMRTPIGPPPRRKKSLNGLGGGMLSDDRNTDESSPGNDVLSSPEGTGQSEQLAFFKDYYSQDEIHAGDLVSTLWAYQPRAQDEFELERGDMVKVVGIWDDGWATGVRIRGRAEEWRSDGHRQRDSGAGNGNGTGTSGDSMSSPEGDGEIKAFPLVCVCLPRHWRRTIEGETTSENIDSSGTNSSSTP
ncbi:hypothetical protein KVT40_004196 [Elsinoe batatas]|uniref:SH3 domain-containing protein n=1 Tax=Elsinoe batatas TaxID=2601811 RepID=A0A8K0L545_9PEZI|nr:hypothetical protein KVT40_004196 [Elsinoe batatas]